MRRLELTPLPLAGLFRVTRRPVGDHRGHFARLFCAEELADAGWHTPVEQINLSHTLEAGTVRGLHFQHPPHSDAKLVTCLAGEVWDVVVDLRAQSPTFLQWHAERLSADNGHALLIPVGFAHGFQTLGAHTTLLYCHNHSHTPSHEGGIHPQDPRLQIDWPMPVTNLSARDAAWPLLKPSYTGLP